MSPRTLLAWAVFLACLGFTIGVAWPAELPWVSDSLRAAKEHRQKVQDRALRPRGCEVVTVRLPGRAAKAVIVCR